MEEELNVRLFNMLHLMMNLCPKAVKKNTSFLFANPAYVGGFFDDVLHLIERIFTKTGVLGRDNIQPGMIQQSYFPPDTPDGDGVIAQKIFIALYII